jgi:uncharacterized protein (DUF3084 family)
MKDRDQLHNITDALKSKRRKIMADKLTPKQIVDILGPHTRNLVNENVALQNRIHAFEQLRDAVSQATGIIAQVEGLTEKVAALEAEVANKQKTLEILEGRSRDMTAGYKPAMIELDNREKQLAVREAAVLAREEKVSLREDRIKIVSGHLSSLGEIDS